MGPQGAKPRLDDWLGGNFEVMAPSATASANARIEGPASTSLEEPGNLKGTSV